MILVDLESPFAGNIKEHLTYARRCMAHSISLNEAPLASHLLYTQPGILDDDIPEDRQIGIYAGKNWALHAQATVVYTDYGISAGMEFGIDHALKNGRPVFFREIGKNPSFSWRDLFGF